MPPRPSSSMGEFDDSLKFARPRAKCNACGCLMTGQAKQLKAHHAKCSQEVRDSDSDGDDDGSTIPSIKHQLSAAEKLLVVKCHAYFKEEKEKEKFLTYRVAPWKTRERVSKCLGISQKTVSQVIADWNRFRDPSFQLKVPRPLPDKAAPCQLATYADTLDAYIQARNDQQLQVTAQLLCTFLWDEHAYAVDVVKMRRFLRKQGYAPGPRVDGRRYFVRTAISTPPPTS
ncbi:Aste57867_22686 [Aphanomyces stellatus]|uniref:Aste57867_22686 protein n=1 Tax=Aphanomyces stellatus TaxID=120398 RepID=A0A485LLX2_9STRA|nr:hypothetical protein As57867_022616 [Aphanomyces stellatus]VFT99340.1 Aste57867_22686 [Aphanomyces stellatus]